MKTLSFASVGLFFLLISAGCNKRFELPQLLEVRYESWTEGDGIRLMLNGDIEEGRCPYTVQCFWQGEARGIMAAEIDSKLHYIPYTIDGLCEEGADPCGNFVDTLGYQFQFLFLSPYPSEVPPSMEYVLKVKVEKN